MERLPLLVSLPHAGLSVPSELADLNRLTPQEIIEAGDLGAKEIYAILATEATHFVSTDISPVFVDMDRAEDEIRKDGVAKTHGCRDVPVYSEPLPPALIEILLERYHRPYQNHLSGLAGQAVVLGVDCQTMAAFDPPVGPDPGVKRPQVCLGNAYGSCPADWMERLQTCFQAHFPGEVSINQPFSGGYITRFHGREMPWVQLKLSRGDFAEHAQKALWVLESLYAWAAMMGFVPNGN